MPKTILFLILTYAFPAFAGAGAKVQGLKLTKIEHGSVYEKLGLKEGDILKSFDGKPIRTAKEAQEFAKALSKKPNSKPLKLVIERAGKEQVLTYEIKD